MKNDSIPILKLLPDIQEQEKIRGNPALLILVMNEGRRENCRRKIDLLLETVSSSFPIYDGMHIADRGDGSRPKTFIYVQKNRLCLSRRGIPSSLFAIFSIIVQWRNVTNVNHFVSLKGLFNEK